MRTIRLSAPLDNQNPSEFSWWQKDLRNECAVSITPPLTGKKSADIAIIGGGFTGMWAALAIKRRDPTRTIMVLEAGRCGDGASSRNGGNVHGYWGAVQSLSALLGRDKALEVARLGTLAQDRIRAFATAPGRNTWWREDGYLRVAASTAQKKSVASLLSAARDLGVPHTVRGLSALELAAYCNSPAFSMGLLFSEGATVNPARLSAALREAVRAAGVLVFEMSPVLEIASGPPCRVVTRSGEVTANAVIMANYTGALALPEVASRTTIFSSFPVMSNPAPEALAASNWTSGRGMADLRMFQHYFRTTPDGRVLVGSGSGRMSLGRDDANPILRRDRQSTERAAAALARFLPAVASAGIDTTWGWPIEVSSDRLPFFGTLPGTQIHYGCGYTGHGVNATYIGGETLASLALQSKDEWSMSPFCTRKQPKLPPEPFRFFGGRFVQWGVLNCEDAEDVGKEGTWLGKFAASLPAKMGLRIGVR
ncbi:FAD-dependent oxidoreductase (plasmid) [Mesorhizobium loti NZP2037]|nr:FAD-dependent oxidoreductase [Mesorhizobium loti]ANN61916.1 FAD-dependent oxidoreductase [Mesorhizobium loti NZP2037]